MIKGRTVSGFEFKIDEGMVDDMRFIDALAEMDSGSLLAVSKVANLMFDAEQKERLYKHLSDLSEDGRVHTEPFIKEIVEIFNYNQKTKN